MNSWDWQAAMAHDVAASISKRHVRGRKNVKGGGPRRRKSCADQRNVEQLESRQMLTVLPNSTVLPSGLAGLVHGGVNVTAETNAVHDKLFAATSNLPLIGSSIAGFANNAVVDSLRIAGIQHHGGPFADQ